jgi:hypothetical protein
MDKFHPPIGVQLFNRLETANTLLNALKIQDIDLDEESIYFVIDGYKGSKNERDLIPDCTDKIAELVGEKFPASTIVKIDRNLGIGRTHHILQALVYESNSMAKWAIFLEEDSIPEPGYLRFMSEFVEILQPYESIVKGSTSQYLNYRETAGISQYSLYAGRGTKAFAERAEWFWERKIPYENALAILIDKSVTEIDKYVRLAKMGYMMENLQKDDLLDRMVVNARKIHLVLPNRLITDIGSDGESGFVEATNFDKLNSDTFKALETLSLALEEKLPEIYVQHDQYLTRNLALIFEYFLLFKNSSPKRIRLVARILDIIRRWRP